MRLLPWPSSHLPLRLFASLSADSATRTKCRAHSKEQLISLVASCNALPDDAIFAMAVAEYVDNDAASVLLQLCASADRDEAVWMPSMFAIGPRITAGPDLHGLDFIVQHSDDDDEQQLESPLVEAGAEHRFAIVVPDRGPVYAGSLIRPKLRIAGPSGIVEATQLLKQERRREAMGAVRSLAFNCTIPVPATWRGAVTVCLEVPLGAFFQLWQNCRELPLGLPTLNLSVATTSDFGVAVTLGLLTGTTLVSPQISVNVFGVGVPVSWSGCGMGCNVSSSLVVVCRSSDMQRRKGAPDTRRFDAQLMLPAQYGGDVNLTVTGWAENADATVLHSSLLAALGGGETQQRTAPPSTDNVTNTTTNRTAVTRSIFDEPSRGLHFVIITLLCYFAALAARTLYYIYRRRKRPEIGFDPSEVGWLHGLLPLHAWVGLVFPFHYRCANIHTTLACATLMGMYVVVSSAMCSDESALVSGGTAVQISIACIAAAVQVAMRPVLNATFHAYTVFDPMEVEHSASDEAAKDEPTDAESACVGLPAVTDSSLATPPISSAMKLRLAMQSKSRLLHAASRPWI